MSQEIVTRDGEVISGALMPAITIEQMVSRHKLIQQCAAQVMKEGADFGVIPGTERKDGTKNLVLLKPGAEKLCTLFGLTPDFQADQNVADFDKGLFFFSYRCVLLRGAAQVMNDAGKVVTIGQIVGMGIGSANSREKKYRREARSCPSCGGTFIKKSKFPPRDNPNLAPRWYCYGKIGGCGAEFEADDPDILNQGGQVDVNEAAELVNTLQKMAQKRSMVAAVLVATNASDLFTQDFGEEEPARQPAPARQPEPEQEQVISAKGCANFRRLFVQHGLSEAKVCAAYEVAHLEDMGSRSAEAVYAILKAGGRPEWKEATDGEPVDDAGEIPF